MDLDRMTPARRPAGRPAGRNAGIQSWRDLLFLHWEVPQEVLRALVPAPLEIDTYHGRAYAAGPADASGPDALHTYTYTCGRGPVHSEVSYTTPAESSSAWGTAQPETLEHFLLERYLLFVQKRDTIHVGQVHHPPYRFAPVHVNQLRDGLLTAAGIETGSRPPDLAHASPGVDVEVFRIEPA